MSNTDHSEIDKPSLLKMLRATLELPAQATMYALALGALALSSGVELPPTLAALAAGTGASALYGILEKVANGATVHPNEIKRAIDDSQIADALRSKETQMLIARLFRRLDLVDFAIKNQEYEVAERLATDSMKFEGLLFELKTDLERALLLLQDIPNRAEQNRVVQLLNALIEMLQSMHGTTLSLIPRTIRPVLFDTPLIGRLQDLEWLRSTSEDRLLVGLPGSGKTFLLQRLARDLDGRFVIDASNRARILHDIRLVQPQLIIVDDAQLHFELLTDLRHFRREGGPTFDIVASCWPGDQERIQEVLGITSSRVHLLDLLSRDEIVEVIRAAGIVGPNYLVYELVNQAEGKPGLAVTLVDVCKQGSVKDIALGDALSRSVKTFFGPLLGREAITILAGFSIGGSYGMSLEAVANALDVSLPQTHAVVTQLAYGGVITPTLSGAISVRPQALREALIRDYFFSSTPLPRTVLESLLGEAPYLPHTATTLIGAVERGANVPEEFLLEVVKRADAEDVWAAYADLGPKQARYVLDNFPELLISCARQLLRQIPGTVIPYLLAAGINDRRALHSTPEHPLRILEDWVEATLPGTDIALEHRKTLFRSVSDWIHHGNDVPVGVMALAMALAPHFEGHMTDPGNGNTVTLYSGFLTADQLRTLGQMWQSAIGIIAELDFADWYPIRELVWNWAYPRHLNAQPSEDVAATMKEVAGQMVHDLSVIGGDHPGILLWLQELNGDLGSTLEFEIDSEYTILYPKEDLHNWQEAEQRQLSAVRQLAERWASQPPVEVCRRIAQIEHEAQIAGTTWPRWTPVLASELARHTEQPERWFTAAMEIGLAGDVLAPLLAKLADNALPEWIVFAHQCLNDPSLRWIAVSEVLRHENVPSTLLTEVLSNLRGLEKGLEFLCARTQLPEATVQLLLKHENPDVALAAAWGEWHAAPQKSIRPNLQESWRAAIVQRDAQDRTLHEHLLTEVFVVDPVLAYDWLTVRVPRPDFLFYQYDRAAPAAIGVQSIEARAHLLHQVALAYSANDWVRALVGNDPALYEVLLQIQELRPFHLSPLAGKLTEAWIAKAQLALDAGFPEEDIAQAVHGESWVWSGKESLMWTAWVEEFEKLLAHPNERVKRVARIGIEHSKRREEDSKRRERLEAIYGRG